MRRTLTRISRTCFKTVLWMKINLGPVFARWILYSNSWIYPGSREFGLSKNGS